MKLVITGTWGVGKTTILAGLIDGVPVVPEPARIALREDPTLGEDWERFAGALLARSIRDFDASPPGLVLFDRGVPDCLAYARWFGLDTRMFEEAATRCRYHDEVVLFPAWDEIYVNDDLRKATFGMAREFEATLVETVESLEYRVVTVPKASIEERELFVRDFVGKLRA